MDKLRAGGAVLPIVRWGNPILHRPTRAVTEFDDADDFYSYPAIADFNRDGQLDIALPNPSGSVNVLFSTCGQPVADLAVTAQDTADPVAEGATVTYSVNVTNRGPNSTSGATLSLSIGVASS